LVLDGEDNPVKVKSISKVPYTGKIYDVDVSNDIVLVRRKPLSLEKKDLGEKETSIAVWSGNSDGDNVSVSSCLGLEFDWIVDPTETLGNAENLADGTRFFCCAKWNFLDNFK